MIVDDKEKMSTLLNSKNVKTLKPYETATGELIPLSGSFNIELLSGESEDYGDIDRLIIYGHIPIATKLEATEFNDIAYYYDLG